MNTWIALFRGINVGGNNILPMAELRAELEALGLKAVRSYIQSGNVIFDTTAKSTKALTNKISGRIEKRFGFRPKVLLLSAEDLLAALAANPFPEAAAEPKTLHMLFLAEPPSDPDLEAIADLATPTERFELTESVFYLHAPDGIGRSKLAAKAERHLGVAGTGRNLRTVEKLRSMVSE